MTDQIKNQIHEKEKNCLFLLSEKGKWSIHEHLKSFHPIYNGAGWFIEEKHKEAVTQISQQVGMKLLEWPLNGETFAQLRHRNRREYLNEKSIKIKLIIEGLKNTLKVNDFEILSEDLHKTLEQIPEGKKLLENIKEFDHLQEQIKQAENEEKISTLNPSIIPIVPINKRIESHNETLKKYRGKKYLGLCVNTIKEFNEKLKGLRKLILLAAAPNVGKTALTVQLAQEVLSVEKDACLVYISLEMTSDEIFTRMNLCLSELDFDTFVLGKEQTENEEGRQPLFSIEELKRIEEATKRIENIGDRLQIIDSSICPMINSDTVINYIERLKNQTNCSRTIVIIDYLQVWPIPQGLRFSSDIEADKWRIGEIKKIRDAVNKSNQDPVIVISETRKPSSGDDAWGGDLSDVMGSARGTYTPDAVLLLSALQPPQLNKLWVQMKMPDINYREDGNEPDDPKDQSNIKGFLARHGIAICNLKMPKARDGMKKFNTLLAFHFHKNKFAPINWLEIKMLASSFKEANKR